MQSCSVVTEYLQQDAPEGSCEYLELQSCNDLETDEALPPTMTSCWRTVKEACGIIQLLYDKFCGNEIFEEVWKDSLFVQSGSLLRSLLFSIKHMGAYAAVYPAYQSFCRAALSSDKANINQIVTTWHHEHLALVAERKENMSIARRSAGLPYLILAVVSVETSQQLSSSTQVSHLFKDGVETSCRPILFYTMRKLFDFARSPLKVSDIEQNLTDVPQVHAHNMLRVLFRDSQMDCEITSWKEEGLLLCFESFQSKR